MRQQKNLQENNAKVLRAAMNKNIIEVKHLIKNGADINAKDHYDRITALWWAAHNIDFEMVKYLVENGVNVTDDGDPLMQAAKKGHLDIDKISIRKSR